MDEDFYAWSVSIMSIGELLSAISFALAVKRLQVKILAVFGLCCNLTGSVMYGTAGSGWMVLVARFLQGIFMGGQSTLLRLYLGETSNLAIKLKKENPGKSQIKNTNFLLTFGLGTLSLAAGPGRTVLCNKDTVGILNIYRLPGIWILYWIADYLDLHCG